MRKALLIVATACALIVGTAGVASAEGNGSKLGPSKRLQTAGYAYDYASGESTADSSVTLQWTNGSDSPIDAKNTAALRVHVPAATADTAYYAEAYSDKALEINRSAKYVTNLSFDFNKTQYVGAGSPRIIVIFANGDVAYLSAFYCNSPIAVSSSWARADFTADKTDCSFYVTGDTANADGSPYAADGTRSAWKVYTDANPDQRVSYTDLVFDEAGDYSLDRISLGAGTLYNRSNLYGVACSSESSC